MECAVSAGETIHSIQTSGSEPSFLFKMGSEPSILFKPGGSEPPILFDRMGVRVRPWKVTGIVKNILKLQEKIIAPARWVPFGQLS